MKKIIVLFSTAFVCANATAQLSIGIQATGNLSGASVKAMNLVSPSKTIKAMPGVGIVADMQAGKNFFVRSGINFQQNGVKISTTLPGTPGEISNISAVASSSLRYLQVPLYAMFVRPVGNIEFYAGAGPYYSFGISGNVKTSVTTNYADGTKETEVYESRAFPEDGGGASEFKRSDYGMGATAGCRMNNGLFLNIGYQLGLMNIDRQSSTDSYKSRAFQIGIGYYFKGRK
jgi:hypothetical protein